MNEVYLVVFNDGEVHSMNEPPTENNLNDSDITYIKITYYPEESQSDMLLEYYNKKEWVPITP
jgi:hypothetical protein